MAGWWEAFWADPNYRSMEADEWRRASAYHFICKRCGCEVWDKETHDSWHIKMGDTTSIIELDLPIRIYNALNKYGINTVEQLVAEVKHHSHDNNVIEYFQDFKNIGYKTAEAGMCAVQNAGYCDTNGRINY